MRILLVTHEASRSGAPRVALLVAGSLVEQGHSVEVVSRAPGPLLPEFAAVAATSIEFLHRVRRKLWRTWAIRGLAYLVDTVLAAVTLIRRWPDLVYVNSTSAAIYLRPARWLGRRVVLHVHESGALAAGFLDAARAPRRLKGITLVACSPSVHTELLTLTDQQAENIAMLPSVPDDSTVLRRSVEAPDRPYSRTNWWWDAAGPSSIAKARISGWQSPARSAKRCPISHCGLFGSERSLSRCGRMTQPEWSLYGPTANPYAHMRRFDVATLPSRDDPFPLVVLEAMLLGTPVVAFAVGGVARQIGDASVVVPPGDVAAFAREVVNLLTDEDARRHLGALAQARVSGLYSTRVFAVAVANLVGTPR